jgi:hypothetical protein
MLEPSFFTTLTKALNIETTFATKDRNLLHGQRDKRARAYISRIENEH